MLGKMRSRELTLCYWSTSCLMDALFVSCGGGDGSTGGRRGGGVTSVGGGEERLGVASLVWGEYAPTMFVR